MVIGDLYTFSLTVKTCERFFLSKMRQNDRDETWFRRPRILKSLSRQAVNSWTVRLIFLGCGNYVEVVIIAPLLCGAGRPRRTLTTSAKGGVCLETEYLLTLVLRTGDKLQ
jgi:hypothetical protein